VNGAKFVASILERDMEIKDNLTFTGDRVPESKLVNAVGDADNTVA